MKTITNTFVAQGRFTQYPGKENVIKTLNNGNIVELHLDKDEGGQIILVNPETNETAGCIPPNPSYGYAYYTLEYLLNLGRIVKVEAFEATKHDKHYRVRVTANIQEL